MRIPIPGAAGVVLAAAAMLVVASTSAAHAESLEVFAGGGTFNATSEGGTGRMTAQAASTSPGGGDTERGDLFVVDNYARVASQVSVERGATYRVTVDFLGARTTEAATGQAAVARGFAEVELYNCCFAGGQSFIRSAETELPSVSGTARVVLDLVPTEDMTLNVQAVLHAYAASSTAYAGQSSVDASTDRTTVSVTKVAYAPAVPEQPRPGRLCLLFVCL